MKEDAKPVPVEGHSRWCEEQRQGKHSTLPGQCYISILQGLVISMTSNRHVKAAFFLCVE